ncbi:hypothetical protein GGI14_000795 [Coemansia sp. S680]|nr:hypothetical protein GGI14_000795 [Coemansia sp. S680]
MSTITPEHQHRTTISGRAPSSIAPSTIPDPPDSRRATTAGNRSPATTAAELSSQQHPSESGYAGSLGAAARILYVNARHKSAASVLQWLISRGEDGQSPDFLAVAEVNCENKVTMAGWTFICIPPIRTRTTAKHGLMIGWSRARFAGVIQLSNKTANTISVFVGPPAGPKQLWRFAYLPPELDEREAIAELTDHTPFEMDSPMLIIGDLNSRLGQLSGDDGDNPRGHILKAHIRATDMEMINTRLPVPQMTFSNHNGSSIVDLVLAEPAAKATILDF